MPKVQPPYYTQVINNWTNRAAQYRQQGIPDASWRQLAIQDISNVTNFGSQPMSTTDVNAAIASQIAGHSLVGNPTSHPHGLLQDIGTAITSIPSDIQGLITNFLPGMIHFLAHLPSELTDTGSYLAHLGDDQWLQDHGYESLHGGLMSDLAESLRNFAKTPIGGIVPGVADVADLTSAAGRQYLMHHPITDILDVAPAGRVLRLGSRAAFEAGATGSAMEALQAGNPYRAALRAGRAGADTLTGRRFSTAIGKTAGVATEHKSAADIWQAAADQFGIGHNARQALRKYTSVGRAHSKDTLNFIREMQHGLDHMTVEEARDLADVMTQPGRTPSLEQEPYVQRFHDLADRLLRSGQDRFQQTRGKEGLLVKRHGKGRLIVAADDPLKKTFRNLDRVSNLLRVQRERLISTAGRMERVQKKIATTEAKIRDAIKWNSQFGDLHRRLPVEHYYRTLRAHQAELEKAKNALVKYQSRQKRYQQLAYTLRRQQYDQLNESGGTASMHPTTTAWIRSGLKDYRTSQYRAELQLLDNAHASEILTSRDYEYRKAEALTQLQDALQTIDTTSTFSRLKSVVEDAANRLGHPAAQAHAKEMFESIRNDVVKNTLNLISHGFDPIWLKHVDPGREEIYTRINPIPDHVADISSYHARVFNFAPFVHDVAVGLVKGAVDLYREQATAEFLKAAVMPWADTVTNLEKHFHDLAILDQRASRVKATYDIAGHAQSLMNAEYEAIDPKTYGLSSFAGMGKFSREDQVMIPKWLATNLHKLTPMERNRTRQVPLRGAYDHALRAFRFAVLTGPRHIVHVAIAGMVPLMMEEPGAILPTRLLKAYQLVHAYNSGDAERMGEAAGRAFGGKYSTTRVTRMLSDSVKHIYDFTDAVYSYSTGHQFGSWMKQFWQATGQNVQHKMARLEETVSDIYRVSTLLSADARGIPRDRALAIANKVAVDMDDMAPFERTIVKQIFPFYGFTRFLFRYLLSYPVDHPYRVSILSRFSTQEQEEWNQQIPQKFQQTLFLGQSDQHGNIKTIDLRNLNPFRSFSNDFSLVGFFQSLNPFPTAILSMAGFNTLQATGDLYPTLQYNAQSGTLAAARPNGGDAFYNALEQFIPEFGALDHFVGITNQMRILKRSNPAAYKQMLYSQLNLPGILTPPVTVNLPYLADRAEMDRYKAASGSVSQAEKTGQYGGIEKYNLIPYQGQYLTPQQFEQMWNAFREQLQQQGLGNIDPRSLLTQPRTRTSTDPLELLRTHGTIPADQSTEGY